MEENEFIAKKVLEINPNLKDKEHYYPWIGLKRIRKLYYNFEWSDGSNFDLTRSIAFWFSNEPNNKV